MAGVENPCLFCFGAQNIGLFGLPLSFESATRRQKRETHEKRDSGFFYEREKVFQFVFDERPCGTAFSLIFACSGWMYSVS